MTETSFQWAHPGFLWLLLLLPLLGFLKGKSGRPAAVGFPSVGAAREAGGRPRGNTGKWMAALRFLSLALLVIALARPQLGKGSSEVEASGIDIMLAIDVSTSMKALDFELKGSRVDRLEAVKDVVARFVQDRPGDRIGILAFAGRPYLVSPLTLDHDWLVKRLESVYIGQVEDGTAIGSAIVSGANHLKNQEAKSKIVIILTDGENNAGTANPETAAEAAAALDIKLYTVGAGTKGTALFPVQGFFGRQEYREIEVNIDEDTLKTVADKTGGKYFRATDTDSLKQIYATINELEKTERKLKKYQDVDEWFLLALIPGILLIGVERILSETLFRKLP